MPRALFVLSLALALFGCDSDSTPPPPPSGDDDSIVAGVDLDVLLAPPTSEERNQAAVDFATRALSVLPEDVTTESEQDVDGATLRVISYAAPSVGTGRFYGLVRLPDRPPGSQLHLPVLVVAPDGSGPVRPSSLFTEGPFAPLGDASIQIMPVAPGRTLEFGDATYTSSTLPDAFFAPFDYEVDLARALVKLVLDDPANRADAERIGAVGAGRGGTVALHLAARPASPAYDFDVRAVAALGPFTDYAAPSFRNTVRRLLLDESVPFPAADAIAARYLLPLRDRMLPLEDVREALVRWSPRYFADALPETLLRHAKPDIVIGTDHSERLSVMLSGRVNFVALEDTRHDLLLEDARVQATLVSFLFDQVVDGD